MICILGDPMGYRHPVHPSENTLQHTETHANTPQHTGVRMRGIYMVAQGPQSQIAYENGVGSCFK